MTETERTRVVVRVDDVKPGLLASLEAWFESHHPDVPVSGFAVATQSWPDAEWQRAARLVRERGWEFGAHTRNHEQLPLVSPERARREISLNVADIEDGLGAAGLDYSVSGVAYPCGMYDGTTVEVVQDLGLDYGVTYTDGLPYASATTVPSGADRYRWGVANNGSLSLESWNAKFDHVHQDGDLYVLCLHPDRWESVLLETLRAFRSDAGLLGTGWRVARRLVLDEWSAGWETLDEHINYIKTHENVVFTTLDDCIADEQH